MAGKVSPGLNIDINIFMICEGRKEGNVLFNDTLNTFHFTVIWHLTYCKEGKEVFYLMTHSTHCILQLYGVGHIVRKERKCFI